MLRKTPLRRAAISAAALALVAGTAIAHTVGADPASALTISEAAQVPYGTAINGGPGNPCGSGVHPGVNREGEAFAAFEVTEFDVDLTITSRTRYDQGVATAMEAYRKHFNRPATCTEANEAKGKKPAIVIESIACKPGASNRPDTFCNLVAANRSAWTYLVNQNNYYAAPSPDATCSSSNPSNRFAGWAGLHAKVTRQEFVLGQSGDVFLHNMNMHAGRNGRLNIDGADAPEIAYGKVLTAAAAEFWADYAVEATTIFNGTISYDFPTNTMYDVAEALRAMAFTTFTINGQLVLDSLRTINAAACTNTPTRWINSVVDPNYYVSRIGLDKTVRDLYDGLGGKAQGYDTPCQENDACGEGMFYDLVYGHWDSHPATSTNQCLNAHGKLAFKHLIQQTTCKVSSK